MNHIEFKRALTKVVEEIRDDRELYYVYQANIAMAFKDAYARNKKRSKNLRDIHEIANIAAKNFLNLWISK